MVGMVEFVVRSPELRSWDAVYLTGDAPELGRWQPDAIRLEWWEQEFRAEVPIQSHRPWKFLFTRGSWRGGELDFEGREQLPHEIHPECGLRFEIEVPGWGRESVRYYPDFPSEHLPHPHTLSIHLPPGYDLDPSRHYPVLYLHDGQNLFDATTSFAGVPWSADETAEQLARLGEVEPIIQVGIANTPDRLKEYGSKPGDPGDLAHRYARFLLEEVKPFIDRTYRTRTGPEHTGIGGSSMGGLISLQLCKWHPEIFGRCAALSPSLWWDNGRLTQEIGDDPKTLSNSRIWLDMGTREGPPSDGGLTAMQRRARKLAEHLRHFHPRRFRYVEIEGGLHNEGAWSARYGEVLKFLFPGE